MKKANNMSMVLSLMFLINSREIGADVFDSTTKKEELSNLEDELANDRFFPSWEFEKYAALTEVNKEMLKSRVPQGVAKYDFKETLKRQVNESDLSRGDISLLLSRLSHDPLMIYQYTSPAQVDLYKFALSLAHLKLIMRYQQYYAIENRFHDPVMDLRYQAQMDCLRKSGDLDIHRAFLQCLDASNASSTAFRTLNDPRQDDADGRGVYLKGTSHLIEDSFKRAGLADGLWLRLKDVLTDYAIIANRDVRVLEAKKPLKAYFLERLELLNKTLLAMLLDIDKKKEIKDEEFKKFKSRYATLHRRQINQISLLSESKKEIAARKLVSMLAYAQTAELYEEAIFWFNRVANHPQIEPGIKIFVEEGKSKIKSDWASLNEAKQWVIDFYFMKHGLWEEWHDRKEEFKNDYSGVI